MHFVFHHITQSRLAGTLRESRYRWGCQGGIGVDAVDRADGADRAHRPLLPTDRECLDALQRRPHAACGHLLPEEKDRCGRLAEGCQPPTANRRPQWNHPGLRPPLQRRGIPESARAAPSSGLRPPSPPRRRTDAEGWQRVRPSRPGHNGVCPSNPLPTYRAGGPATRTNAIGSPTRPPPRRHRREWACIPWARQSPSVHQ
jgi:hypothetical protein